MTRDIGGSDDDAPVVIGRARPIARALGLAALIALPALAQEAAPLLGPRPVFVPGLYETESRNSHFQDQGVKSQTCFASADADAYRSETMEQYRSNPQFMKACRLSDTRDLPDGYAFAMDCTETKIVLTVHFVQDMVSSTIQTLMKSRPEFSSEILTLSHRIGECPGQEKPGRKS